MGRMSMEEIYDSSLGPVDPAAAPISTPNYGMSCCVDKYFIVDKTDVDVYGERPPVEPPDMLECAHCQRQVHPLRFAPHLDKCMGVGGRRVQRSVSYSTAFQDIDLPNINDGESGGFGLDNWHCSCQP